jgi:flagellar hook-associated protein 1 FlgK
MTSPFFGINIGASALRTAQTLVDIANQNIANANTPGYSRQTGKVGAMAPYPVPAFNAGGNPGQLGTGVQITEVNRARDTFIDYQMRNQLNGQGQANARRDALAQVEATVNEPSLTGLNSTLTKYWSAWQEVANSPADSAIRANLVEQGKAVADAFKGQISQFAQQQRDLDQQVGLSVTNVNTLTSQIAALNLQVSQVEVSGMHANDLRDQRDQLVDSLSKLVKINVVESSDGSVYINVGNHQLVERSTAHQMVANTAAGAFTQIQWPDGTAVDVGTGQIQGLVESRDELLQERIDGVNALAGRVIESVNSLSASGVGLDGIGGRKFFAGSDASSIAIDSQLTAAGGTDKVAAARLYADATSPTGYSSAAGDSSNAVAIAQLANLVAQRNPVLGDLTQGPIGALGVSLVGIDLSGAAANTTYTFAVGAGAPPTVTVTPPGTGTATISIGKDSASVIPPANLIFTIDTGTSRLTLSAPPGTTLSDALAGLDGKTITTNPGPSTIGDQYGRQIASLGVESQTAKSQSVNQGVLINQLDMQRQSTSGVSLDEETINLITYQKAYQAAARVVTVMDEMLDTLINGTGRVGR